MSMPPPGVCAPLVPGDLSIIGVPGCKGSIRRDVLLARQCAQIRVKTARAEVRPWPSRRVCTSACAVIAVLVVIVLSVPAHAQPSPWRLKPIGGWGGPVNHVQVDGDIAYVGSGQRLVILDISDESNPIEIGSVSLMTTVQSFVMRDGYVYIASTSRFSVVDVSNVVSPRIVWHDTRRDIRKPREVDVRGDIVYVRDDIDLEAFDITDPESPIHEGRVLTATRGFRVLDVEIVGDLMYIAPNEDPDPDLGWGYFPIYDLSADPLNPTLRGSVTFFLSRRVRRVEVEGTIAYLLVDDFSDGKDETVLWTVDVADPDAPLAISRTVVVDRNDPGNARFPPPEIGVSDGFVYVAEWATETVTPRQWNEARGLLVFDATDPTAPVLVGSQRTHGTVRSVRAGGDRLYMLDDGEGLLITDITNRSNPQIVGNYHSPALLARVAREGDLLYVSDAWNGFSALDVSDAARPELVGVYQTPNAGLGIDNRGIEVVDGQVRLTVGYDGLEIIDASDPSLPTLIGAWRNPPPEVGQTLALDVSTDVIDGRTIAAVCAAPPRNGLRSLWFLDITNPDQIEEVGTVFFDEWDPTSVVIGELPSGDATAFVGSERFPWIVDVSDMLGAGPAVLNHALTRPSKDVAYANGFRYVANEDIASNGPGGLYIQDVTNPSVPDQPVIIRQRATLAVSLGDDRVYMTSEQPSRISSLLRVYDVHDPSDPIVLAEIADNIATYTSLLAEEPYLFATSAVGGVDAPIATGLLVIVSACTADFTGAANPNDPDYGMPNGLVDADDFFYFLDQFVAGNADVADLTGSSNPNDPDYGVPNGVIDADDFFYFLDAFVVGCP